MVKDQVVAAEVSTPFFKCSLLRASCCNFGRSSIQTHIIPSLGPLVVLQLFLGATSRGSKESIGFPDSERYPESFEKKIDEQNQIF